jgi:hypothetical protein
LKDKKENFKGYSHIVGIFSFGAKGHSFTKIHIPPGYSSLSEYSPAALSALLAGPLARNSCG